MRNNKKILILCMMSFILAFGTASGLISFYTGDIYIQSIIAHVDVKDNATVNITYILKNNASETRQVNLGFFPDDAIIGGNGGLANPVVFGPDEEKSIDVTYVLDTSEGDTKILSFTPSIYFNGMPHSKRAKLQDIEVSLPDNVTNLISSSEPYTSTSVEDNRDVYYWHFENMYPISLYLRWNILNISVELTKNATPEVTAYNQPIDIAVRIKNKGTFEIRNITLMDTFHAGDYVPIGQLDDFIVQEGNMSFSENESIASYTWYKNIDLLGPGEAQEYHYTIQLLTNADTELSEAAAVMNQSIVAISNPFVISNKLCGNGVCDPNENYLSCDVDCPLTDDYDNDGVNNSIDNCPHYSNTDQIDTDGDGMGDICDPYPSDSSNDGDGDGHNIIAGDNCPTIYNIDQNDNDSDGYGDVCDNCPGVFNSDQSDKDEDGIGDTCDNCPDVFNSDQSDTDADGIGDACNCHELLRFYQDSDIDMYGNAAVSRESCIPPEGYIEDNTDCNDNNAHLNPGTAEICNGMDDNCNGLSDENDAEAPITTDNAPVGWQNNSLTINLTAIDYPAALGRCGVSETYYCIDESDNCTPEASGTVLELSREGTNYIRYYSIDNYVGNTEPVKSTEVKMDKTPPVTHINISGMKESEPYSDWYIDNASITFIGTDVISGVSATYYCIDQTNTCDPATRSGASIVIDTKGINYLRYRSVDNALNNEEIETFIVRIDRDSDGDGLYDNSDSCPTTHGKIQYQGCPVGDDNFVVLHVIDKAHIFCGGRENCKVPVEGASVRVFDRNNIAFQAAYTKNPAGTKYPEIFEANIGVVGKCTTNNLGECIAGEEKVGNYLVIVKYGETGNVVYTGKQKDPTDFKDTDSDMLGDLATKDFQIMKVINKDGTLDYKAGSKTVITGSILEIISPEYVIWENNETVYPFIFASDSNWTIDICISMPKGYEAVEGNCTQALVANETKEVLFKIIEVGSPEPEMLINIKTEHEGKLKTANLNVPGLRSAEYMEATGRAGLWGYIMTNYSALVNFVIITFTLALTITAVIYQRRTTDMKN